jgi:hypothetical protein
MAGRKRANPSANEASDATTAKKSKTDISQVTRPDRKKNDNGEPFWKVFLTYTR